MKKNKKLMCSIFAVVQSIAVCLVPYKAQADTSIIKDGVGGWTKITALPEQLTDYYFVFVDNTADLMLSYGEGVNQSSQAAYKTMVYRTSANPAMNPAMLWEITTNSADGNSSWSIKSAVEPTFFIQTESDAGWYCRTHEQSAENNTWCKWIIDYADAEGYWTIQNGKYPSSGYVGPWIAAAFSNGQEVAANKTNANVGHFQIYAIRKADVNWEANASESNLTYKIANSYAASNDKTGWIGTGSNTRNGGSGFDGVAGFFEFCDWWASSWSGSLSQTITGLPEGKYRIRAAGQLSATDVTLTIDVNGTSANFPANGTSNGTILASGKETTAGSGVAGWQYVTVEKTITDGTDLTITFSSTGNAQFRWANVDNVELYYLGPVENVYEKLQVALDTYKPYNDIPEDETGYTRAYNTYETYTEETSESLLNEAIAYLQNNYATYQWIHASPVHPVDVTEGVISGWECTSNDAWPGSGRTTATGTYYNGASRTYFTQNHEDSPARSQAVTIPKVGAYLLRTIVRPCSASSYATISVGSASTTTRGVQTGSADVGYGWAYNDIYFTTTSENEDKTISISLSNVNNAREADCGEMHLLYIGQKADFVKDGVHKYVGTYATAPTLEVTDDVPVVDVTDATFSSGTSDVTFINPNGLVFVASDGQTSASKNEVVGTICANLQLEKGHPFMNPTEFTATAAKYTLEAAELAGGKFATLMIPFAATGLAGKTYTLDQGVDLIDGNIRGTVVGSIDANAPVLVTTSGEYAGSNVAVPVVAPGATYTQGELVGTYTAINAPANSFVLQNHTSGEGVAFYYVGATQPKVTPFRAYIKPQAAGVRALRIILDGDVDAIGAIDERTDASALDIYGVDGIRRNHLRKGINIIRTSNGSVKKVNVK